MIINPFGGPGGWDLGARLLGLDDPIGVEWEPDACATRRAAGLPTIQADVSTAVAEHGGLSIQDHHAQRYHHWPAEEVVGFIASPPCTAFSSAGKGKGRKVIPELVAAIERGDWSARPDPDPTVWLVLEVGRWVDALQPEWIALEQVPLVVPIWEAYARHFERLGYHAWAGKVTAEQYGVPQTRQRAVLLASRARSVGPPPCTHQRYDSRLADGGRHGLLKPWVSMADALGWNGQDLGALTTGANSMRDNRNPEDIVPYEREVDAPAPTVIPNTGRSWKVKGSPQEKATERELDEPAPTILGGNQGEALRLNTGRDWKKGGTREDAQKVAADAPAPAIDSQGGKMRWEREPGLPSHGVRADVADRKAWADDRPATTVATRPLVPDPGANANRHNGATKSRNDGIRVEVADCLVLQSFPADHPVQGTRTSQFRQVGNAVPPLLAAHVLAVVTGRPAPEAP